MCEYFGENIENPPPYIGTREVGTFESQTEINENNVLGDQDPIPDMDYDPILSQNLGDWNPKDFSKD